MDRLEGREALQEVRRLRTQIRRDSRGRAAVLVLVGFWIGSPFISEVVPNRSPLQWLLAAGYIAVPAVSVWYLERTSKRFGGAQRAQIIARFILVHLISFALVLASGLLGRFGPYLGGVGVGLSLFFWTLGGALMWYRWYGTLMPWFFALLTQVLAHWVRQKLGPSDGLWSGVEFAFVLVVAGYVCMDSTLRRLASRES